jgi:NAD(P)H-dependent FMN reductase
MKVLAIIGSPKGKGNSYKVTKKLEMEMKTLEEFEFEYLFLKDFNLEMCRGCFSCVKKGQNFCPIKDDIDIIKDKMHKSDGLIFVSPCYCQNVTGIMKNFIDRLSYLFHRPEFFKQKALAVSTTAGSGLKETLEYLSKLEIWGFGPLVQLGTISPPWPAKEGLKMKNNKNISDAAEKFSKKLKTEGLPSPSFTQYTHFRFLKKTSELKEYMPRDHEFYKDKEEYFIPVKINFLYKIIVSIMLPIIFYIMRDMGPADQ